MIRLALALVSLLFIGFNYASGEDELYCLAQNIYFEAGNQPLAGKIAVANVTFNRVEDPQFPDTICGVVYQAKTRVNWKGDVVPIKHKCQFSWYCDGKPDVPTDSTTWRKSVSVAMLTARKDTIDITDGSLYYHADYIAPPHWVKYLTPTVQIQTHKFYK